MNTYIDIYCERLEPGLWAEPVNALTNLAFFIAALMAGLLAWQTNRLNAQTITLIALVAVIGTGSTLFHTFATKWAMLSDSIPILFYQIAFLIFYGRHIVGLSWLKTFGLFFAFAVTIIAFYQIPHDVMNGSLNYGPAILFLLVLAGLHFRKFDVWPKDLVLAALVFAASLTFRSIDMALCEAIPFGTHFMWHILNGVVLYLTARAYILALQKTGS